MGYLIDTHALIWWWLGDPQLSRDATNVLENRGSPIHVTAITGIEIALKVRAGKLDAMVELLDRFDESIAADGFRHLVVRYDHAIRAGLLEGRHRDPFDRLIAAQALTEDLVVVTRDEAFASFGCKVLW